MGLIDIPEITPGPELAALRLRHMTKQTTDQLEQQLEGMRRMVARWGIPALRAELGVDDTAVFSALYTAYQNAILLADPERIVPNVNEG